MYSRFLPTALSQSPISAADERRCTLIVGLKASLSECLKRQRLANHLSQEDLARLVKSSQSRIAKMEKGDPSVSIDLLIKSLLALGTTRPQDTIGFNTPGCRR